jgi:glycine/D-amino acid oxidase-like deaminating enzyme
MIVRKGFDADWWEEEKIALHFPFRKPGAIVTRGDAEINPYKFVQALAEDAARHGLRIHEKSPMLDVESVPGGGYRVVTDAGEIETEHVIYAVGYVPETAGGRWIKACLNRSYGMVTEPLPSLSDWHERWLIWETAHPYLYLRTTADNRIIIGGLDEKFRTPVLNLEESLVRAKKLLAELGKLFPDLRTQVKYHWCATFGESKDGLPWIGEDPDRPGQHYCLGYGGNGMIYSMLGAHLIRDNIIGERHPVADIVRPDRSIAAAKSRVPN